MKIERYTGFNETQAYRLVEEIQWILTENGKNVNVFYRNKEIIIKQLTKIQKTNIISIR